MSKSKKPLLLLILDGYGYSEKKLHNASYSAKTPIIDNLWIESPHSLIGTSGPAVGLPEGQMGNSEVGHVTLGSGRVIHQNLSEINNSIKNGDFFLKPEYINAIDEAIAKNKAVHIFGLLSPGGVHSHEDHINNAIRLAVMRGAKKVYLHAFLDGRDTPPRSAEKSIKITEAILLDLGVGEIASISGRFYAMDRDRRWERTKEVYDMLTNETPNYVADSALKALSNSYKYTDSDEFVLPTKISLKGKHSAIIDDGDVVIFMNFRPDRARQITNAFLDEDFKGFTRKKWPKLGDFVTTTQYSSEIPAPIAFPPKKIYNSLGEYLSNQGKTQLRIAETEKYAHVTFFFSGGQEGLFEGESRTLIPSPKVATYDLMPEMSAYELTEKLIDAINSKKFDAIICNYANCDQVGHSGVFDAAIKAVEVVDKCIGKILKAINNTGGQCLITADHGNVELMFDEETRQPHTQHTTLPVPLIYIGEKQISLADEGSLSDIAPTILALMDLPQPEEMTGKSLIKNH
jgi:2,3-bisphosphoglycerate-independent phosphoglycerate mutase